MRRAFMSDWHRTFPRCSTAAGPWAGGACSGASRARTPPPCRPSASTGMRRCLPMGATGPRRRAAAAIGRGGTTPVGPARCSRHCRPRQSARPRRALLLAWPKPRLESSCRPRQRGPRRQRRPHLHAGDRKVVGHRGRHRHVVPARRTGPSYT